MSFKVVYAGGPNPEPTERYILRYWKLGDLHYQTHGTGFNSRNDAIAQAKAFQHSGWCVQVLDTEVQEGWYVQRVVDAEDD